MFDNIYLFYTGLVKLLFTFLDQVQVNNQNKQSNTKFISFMNINIYEMFVTIFLLRVCRTNQTQLLDLLIKSMMMMVIILTYSIGMVNNV